MQQIESNPDSLDSAAPPPEPAAPAPIAPLPPLVDIPDPPLAGEDRNCERSRRWGQMGREIVGGMQTLLSAAVYATLIVTFGFQVARVDGPSMAPTLEDHDRLIVNKLVYEIGDPRP